jgi:hypothetical protein
MTSVVIYGTPHRTLDYEVLPFWDLWSSQFCMGLTPDQSRSLTDYAFLLTQHVHPELHEPWVQKQLETAPASIF